jgi:hypothetical protein
VKTRVGEQGGHACAASGKRRGAALAAVAYFLAYFACLFTDVENDLEQRPAHGDLAAAFRAARFLGTIGGLVLGTVFATSRQNRLAPILTHALITALPGMTSISFGPAT